VDDEKRVSWGELQEFMAEETKGIILPEKDHHRAAEKLIPLGEPIGEYLEELSGIGVNLGLLDGSIEASSNRGKAAGEAISSSQSTAYWIGIVYGRKSRHESFSKEMAQRYSEIASPYIAISMLHIELLASARVGQYRKEGMMTEKQHREIRNEISALIRNVAIESYMIGFMVGRSLK
jgi:hypothetical protein